MMKSLKIRKKFIPFVFLSLLVSPTSDVKPLSTSTATAISMGIPLTIMLSTYGLIIKYEANKGNSEDIAALVTIINMIFCAVLINRLTKLTPAHKFKKKCSQIVEKINHFAQLINNFNFQALNDEAIIKNLRTMYEEHTRFPLVFAYKDLKSIFLEFRVLKKLIVDANLDIGIANINQKEFVTGSPNEDKALNKLTIINPIDTIINTISFINLCKISRVFLTLKKHPEFIEELKKFKMEKKEKEASIAVE